MLYSTGVKQPAPHADRRHPTDRGPRAGEVAQAAELTGTPTASQTRSTEVTRLPRQFDGYRDRYDL